MKASTGEGLGFVGRGEGVAALAVATLSSTRARPPFYSSARMHGELVVLAVLVGAGAFLLLAERTQIPYPILLSVGGTALAFVPGVDEFVLDPDLILVTFLPPLLYGAAFFSSLQTCAPTTGRSGCSRSGWSPRRRSRSPSSPTRSSSLPWAGGVRARRDRLADRSGRRRRDRRPLARAAAAGDDRRGRVR